jgi:hypothetical protein
LNNIILYFSLFKKKFEKFIVIKVKESTSENNDEDSNKFKDLEKTKRS